MSTMNKEDGGPCGTLLLMQLEYMPRFRARPIRDLSLQISQMTRIQWGLWRPGLDRSRGMAVGRRRLIVLENKELDLDYKLATIFARVLLSTPSGDIMKNVVCSRVRATLKLSAALSAYAALMTALPGLAANETPASDSSAGPDAQSSNTQASDTQTADSAQGPKLAEILVRGSRLPTSLATMPQSVQIVNSQQLEQQMAITTDVQTMLANTVPGLSQSSYSTGETLLSLRGRKPVILIDGVPVTSTLNDTGRELSMISPEDISEVEVIRGSSALYGQSEGAGFINFLTKGGEAGPANFRTEVGSGVSLANPSADSLIPYVSQSAAGTIDDFDYRAGGTFTSIRSLYDADGDRLPPPVGAAIQNSQTASGFAKGGYNFGGDQRLEATSLLRQGGKLGQVQRDRRQYPYRAARDAIAEGGRAGRSAAAQ